MLNSIDKKITSLLKILLLTLLALPLSPIEAWASALTTQSILLQPGWNSVFIELEPDDGDAATSNDDAPSRVFNLSEIEKVWGLPPSATTIQYIANPSEIGVGNPDWRVYIPTGQPTSALTNLLGVSAGRVYLIKIAGAQPKTLEIRGSPEYKRIQWKPESFNLVGFYANPVPAQQVSFAEFLAIPAGSNPAIYHLSNDIWQLLNKNALVEHGKGYWIYNDGGIQQTGPLDVNSTVENGLGFGQLNSIKPFTVINRSTNPIASLQFALQDFPLQYFNGYTGPDNNTPDWRTLQAATTQVDSGKDKTLLLGVDRAQLTAGTEGIVTLSASGMRLQLPLKVDIVEANDHGLWVGTAMVNAVSNVNATDPSTTEPIDTPLTMKLLLHSSDNGVFLLKQVYLLGDYSVPDEMRTVLVTQDERLPNYTPLALSRGKNAGFRLSSSAFDFSGSKLALTGSLANGGNLTGDIVVSPTLPTHPMLHQWHPDHDNRRNDNFQPIGATEFSSPFNQEVWEITRNLRLNMESVLPASTNTGLGRISGTYQETINGIHKLPVVMRGRFYLERVSLITDLDL